MIKRSRLDSQLCTGILLQWRIIQQYVWSECFCVSISFLHVLSHFVFGGGPCTLLTRGQGAPFNQVGVPVWIVLQYSAPEVRRKRKELYTFGLSCVIMPEKFVFRRIMQNNSELKPWGNWISCGLICLILQLMKCHREIDLAVDRTRTAAGETARLPLFHDCGQGKAFMQSQRSNRLAANN